MTILHDAHREALRVLPGELEAHRNGPGSRTPARHVGEEDDRRPARLCRQGELADEHLSGKSSPLVRDPVHVDHDDLERARPHDLDGHAPELRAGGTDDEHPLQIDARRDDPRRVQGPVRIDPRAPCVLPPGLSRTDGGQRDARGPSEGTGRSELDHPARNPPVGEDGLELWPFGQW
jgi:hypothetical protein